MRLSGADRDGKQNHVNGMFSSTDKICQVPVKDGRTIQRNVEGTHKSFHTPDVGFRLKAQFDASNTSQATQCEVPRYPWHHYPASDNIMLLTPTSSEVVAREKKLRDHRKMRIVAGHTPVAHLQNLQLTVDQRFDATASPLNKSEAAARSALKKTALTMPPGSSSRAHASPWLDETESPVRQDVLVQRHSHARGAGHVKTMAPANTPKLAGPSRLDPPAFDWASTGSHMESHGETCLSAKHGREALAQAAAITRAEAHAEEKAQEEAAGLELEKASSSSSSSSSPPPPSSVAASTADGPRLSGSEGGRVLRGLKLPHSTTERANALTKLLADKHGKDRVPGHPSYQRMDVAMPRADKALNPFGRPQPKELEGFVARAPPPLPGGSSADTSGLLVLRPSPSRRLADSASDPPTTTSSAHYSISLRPSTSAAATPCGWPVGGFYSTASDGGDGRRPWSPSSSQSARPNTAAAASSPTPRREGSRPATSSSSTSSTSGRALTSRGGGGCSSTSSVVGARAVSRESARALSSMGLGLATQKKTTAAAAAAFASSFAEGRGGGGEEEEEEEPDSVHYMPAVLRNSVGVGGTQEQLEDKRFEDRMRRLKSSSAQRGAHRLATMRRPTTGGGGGGGGPGGSGGGNGSGGDSTGLGPGFHHPTPGVGFHLSHKLAPRDTHSRVFDPTAESRARWDAEVATSAVEHAVDPRVAPPIAAASEAEKWGELTSVLDNFMHPSNNPNRTYPTPEWVPPYVHKRKAFKLRV